MANWRKFVKFKKPVLEIQPTTLWDYPSQHYGRGMQGRADYRGNTVLRDLNLLNAIRERVMSLILFVARVPLSMCAQISIAW